MAQTREYQAFEKCTRHAGICDEHYPVLAQFLQNLLVAMAYAIVTKKNCRFVQAPRRPSVTFGSQNQCVTKIFDENVANHVRGVDYLDLEVNILPGSMVEDRQHPRFAESKKGQ
jgi:hypothetical protein